MGTVPGSRPMIATRFSPRFSPLPGPKLSTSLRTAGKCPPPRIEGKVKTPRHSDPSGGRLRGTSLRGNRRGCPPQTFVRTAQSVSAITTSVGFGESSGQGKSKNDVGSREGKPRKSLGRSAGAEGPLGSLRLRSRLRDQSLRGGRRGRVGFAPDRRPPRTPRLAADRLSDHPYRGQQGQGLDIGDRRRHLAGERRARRAAHVAASS